LLTVDSVQLEDVTGVACAIVSFSASRKGRGGYKNADAVSAALIKATRGLM